MTPFLLGVATGSLLLVVLVIVIPRIERLFGYPEDWWLRKFERRVRRLRRRALRTMK